MAQKQKQPTAPPPDAATPEAVPAKEPTAPAKNPRLQAIYQELLAQEESLLAELQPHRDFYEAHANDPRYLEARAKIKEVSGRLAPVRNELAALAKALGGRAIQVESGAFQGGE
jgi:cell division septum initiation protein DivIVA